MNPRLASARLELTSYARDVYRTSVEKWSKLPMQWRGFVLHHQHAGHSADVILDLIERGQATATLDPQGVYDAFTGVSPQ
jgi:hypothetical protein